MASSGVAGRRNIDGVSIRILPPEEVYDGIPAPFAIEMANRARRPLFLMRVSFRGETFPFYLVPAGTSRRITRQIVVRDRGERELGEAIVSSPFPVNFFVRINRFYFPDIVVVFPAPKIARADIPVDPAAEGFSSASPRRGQSGELIGIGDYTGREPMKLVHWRLSARHATLKIQERGEAGLPPLIVDVAALSGGLEERLQTAAGMINTASRQGRPVGVRIGNRIVPPGYSHGHRLRLLTELARA